MADPVHLSDFARSVIPRAADVIEEGMPSLDRKPYEEALVHLSDFEGRDRARIARQLKGLVRDRKSQIRGAAKFSALARAHGMPEESERVLAAAKKAAEGRSESPGLVESAGTKLFEALDVPHKYAIRSWSTPEREGDKPGEIVSSPEWMKRHREESDKEDGSLGSKALVGAADFLGYVPGTAIGGFVGAAGAASDVMAGRPVDPKRVEQTIEETRRDAADLIATIVTDPLSWISLGSGGAAKGAATAAARSTARAGLSKGASKALGGAVDDLVRVHGGTKEAWPQVQRAFAKHYANVGKTADEGFAAAKKVFGETGEFLGRDQARISVPFIERAGVDVAALTGKEFGGGKLLQQLHKPIRKASEELGGAARPLFSQEKSLGKNLKRMARARAQMLEESINQELLGLAEMAPATKKRRDEIVRKYIDPDASLEEAATEVTMPGLAPKKFKKGGRVALGDEFGELVSRKSDDTWQVLFRNSDTGKSEVFDVATKDLKHAPLDRKVVAPKAVKVHADADEILTLSDMTAKEQDWVDGIADFFARRKDELVEAGLMSKNAMAKNPLSGRYFPRRFRDNFGVLAELGPGGVKAGPSRTANVALGALDDTGVGKRLSYLKGETDPNVVMPRYGQAAARSIAKDELSKRVAMEFGVAPGAGSSSTLKRTTVTMHGREVPADIANIVEGSFDTSLETFSGALKKLGVDRHPLGRAATEALDLYAQAVNSFKTKVLVKVPGYHTVNMWNDGLQMAVDGNMNPAASIRSADRLLSGRLDGIKTPSGFLGRDEVVRLAKEQGIPIDITAAGHRLDLYGSTGMGAQKTSREMDQIARRFAEPEELGKMGRVKKRREAFDQARREIESPALRAVAAPQRGERLAGWWEARSKMGHFVHRLQRGDNAIQAADRTFKVLLDYSDRGKGLQVMRWFMPFATWTAKAPMMTARALGRNPSAVSNVGRFFEHMTPEQKYGAPRHASERAPTYELSPRGAEIHGNLRQALGRAAGVLPGVPSMPGRPAQPGYGTVFLPRDPFSESFTMPGEVATGNFDPAWLSLGMAQKAIIENLGPSGARDLLTKREAQRASPLAMFPAGTPAVPRALQAAPGSPGQFGVGPQHPWFTRYVAPYLANPMILHALNRAIYARGGPVNTLGSTRLYAQNDEDLLNQQLLGLFTRIPTYKTTPVTPLYDQRASGASQAREAALNMASALRREQRRSR